MRKNKDIVFEYVQKQLLSAGKHKGGLQTNEIADRLGMQRTNVSSILNKLVAEGRLLKTNTRPVYYSLPKDAEEEENTHAFESMIGRNGSLRKAVSQTQAVMLYPSANRNIQLVASSGSGMTHFGKEIHKFAVEKKLIGKNDEYQYVNCRYFNKNINVLNDVLFGDMTGVKNSCFAKAQGGMLFLDHVDLLTVKQYSRLCHYIESGAIYSESGVKLMDCSDCIFVFATTVSEQEDIQTEWRNATTIRLPQLEERPLTEKFELINHFFTEEAGNSKCTVEVTAEVVRALMATVFVHGVKELRLAIRSACANAYIRVLDEPEKNMCVCLNDFKENVQNGRLRYRSRRTEIDELVGSANFMLYDMQSGLVDTKDYQIGKDVYDNIMYQYTELSERGVSDGSIREAIEAYVDSITRVMTTDAQKSQGELKLETLSKMVDVRVINAVSLLADNYKKEHGRSLSNKVFYGICLHVNSLITMQPLEHTRITDEQVKQIIRDYPSEYGAMIEFAGILEDVFQISISVEEVVLLTMLLLEPEAEQTAQQPVMLYAMQGNGAAKYLAAVTNVVTQENNSYGFDLNPEYDSGQALELLEHCILQINRGGGVIVIYDVPVFVTMLNLIAERTNIKIRCIHMPVTLTGIEVARKCAQNADIDKIYHGINQELRQRLQPAEHLKRIIVTLCHTSEGGALQLKKYIDQYSRLHMRTIPLAVADKEVLIREVLELKKTYTIHAFVGTFDPQLFGIPFISIADVFECEKEDIDRVLMFESVRDHRVDYDTILQNWKEAFTHISYEKMCRVLPKVTEELGTAYNLQYGEKIGLCIHIACLLESVASGTYVYRNQGGTAYLEQHREDYLFVLKTLKTLEKQFDIIINDEEVGIILMILRTKK